MHKNKEEKTRDEEFKRNNSLENFLSEINKRIDKENDKEVINEWLESKKEINKFLFT